MMSLNISLNASVGSTEVLVATGGAVLLGTVEEISIMVVRSGTKGFNKLDLTSKGGECLVGSAMTAVNRGGFRCRHDILIGEHGELGEIKE